MRLPTLRNDPKFRKIRSWSLGKEFSDQFNRKDDDDDDDNDDDDRIENHGSNDDDNQKEEVQKDDNYYRYDDYNYDEDDDNDGVCTFRYNFISLEICYPPTTSFLDASLFVLDQAAGTIASAGSVQVSPSYSIFEQTFGSEAQYFWNATVG